MIYYASPKCADDKWYYFCMVDFDNKKGSARIHVFLKYQTTGAPIKIFDIDETVDNVKIQNLFNLQWLCHV